MKKIILMVMAFFAVSFTLETKAQCSIASATWGQYPSATRMAPTVVGVETIIQTGSWAGEYMKVSGFQAGAVYNWSLCGASYDTQLTIRNWNTGAVVAYNDDFCGLQSQVTFTSDGSDLRVQINRFFCASGTTSTTHRATLVSEPVIVGDPPLIQCPVDVVVSNDANQCGAIVNFADAVAIDPDGDLDVVLQTAGLPSGSEFPVGVNTVEFTAYDLGGNQSTCTFTITVEDVQDPVIECLSEYTVELGTTGEYTLDPEELLASFSDNCGIVNYVIGGALIPETRELTTLFAAGNGGALGGAVYFDVNVLNDITLTGLYVHTAETGAFTADIYTIVGGTYVGNQTNAGAWTLLGTVSGTAQGLGTPSEGTFGSSIALSGGTNYAMAVVMDASHGHDYTNGNGSNQFYSNGDVEISLGSATNVPFTGSVFNPRIFNGGVIYEALISGGPQDALLECSDIGQVGISITAFDAAGNSVSCNTLVTVQDTTAPIIVCDGEPIAGDFLEEFEGASIPAGWTTEILAGTADWQFGSGDMPTGPDFPTNAAIFDDDAAGSGNVNYSRLISPVYNLAGVAEANLTFDYAHQEFLGDGSLQVEVFDGSAWQEVLYVDVDLAAIQTANIDVLPYANQNFQVRFNYDDEGGWSWAAGVDNFHLTYSAPSSTVQVVLDSNGLANYDASDLLISVEEGCDYTVTVEAAGITTGDLSTTYVNGNGGAAGGAIYFDVTAIENISLTALDLHIGETGAFTVEVYANPGGTYIGNETNAGAWTLVATGTGDANGAGVPSTATLGAAVDLTAGTTYGMALVLDVDHGHDYTNGDGTNQNYANDQIAFAGGSATNQPFTGNVFNPRVFNGGFHYEYLGTTAVENFDFDCSYLGVNNIEVTVTDSSGNVATCISAVEVIDVDDPILVCQDATVSLDENGMAEVLPEYFIDPVNSFDNCGITITAVDVTDVTCADIGTPITVTVFVSDDSGNIAACQATMTVVDDMGPVLEGCPEDMTVDPGAVDLFYEVPDYTVGVTATDNCSDPAGAITQDPPAGTLLPDGVYTVTLSSTDDEGNVGSCSFELTVESVLGVTSNQLNAGVAIYPNPARNVMNIGNSTDIQLERAVIYDLNGRMIQSIDLTDMSTEASVNVAHLASGVYMVQLQAQDGQAIKRLVKE